MIRFEVHHTSMPLQGKLLYMARDHTLDFMPDSLIEREQRAGSFGETSLTLGTLQLQVGIETRQVLYAWGLFNFRHFARLVSLSVPDYRPGNLLLASNIELVPGVSISIAAGKGIEISYDPLSGWICIGESSAERGQTSVEFAQGCIAILSKGLLRALWLHPYSV